MPPHVWAACHTMIRRVARGTTTPKGAAPRSCPALAQRLPPSARTTTVRIAMTMTAVTATIAHSMICHPFLWSEDLSIG